MIPIFYSPAYVGTGHSFDTTRKSQWIAEALQRQAAGRIELRDPGLLSEEEIARFHSAEYVRAVRTGQPRRLAESQGFPWDSGVWTMAQAVNAGLVRAALAALESGVAGSLSSGIHHARRREGVLFCTFNGLVLAANAAIDAGAESVLILDTDAHCGGGTHSLICDNERIWQRDLAVNFMDRYEENGRTALTLIDSADDYLPALEQHCRELLTCRSICASTTPGWTRTRIARRVDSRELTRRCCESGNDWCLTGRGREECLSRLASVADTSAGDWSRRNWWSCTC